MPSEISRDWKVCVVRTDGTANDFATSCGIPTGDPLAALTLLTQHKPTPIDIGKVNDRYFINVASGGFGADVTVATPPQMKKALGGAAYSLMGLVTAAKMSPYRGTLTTSDGEESGLILSDGGREAIDRVIEAFSSRTGNELFQRRQLLLTRGPAGRHPRPAVQRAVTSPLTR